MQNHNLMSGPLSNTKRQGEAPILKRSFYGTNNRSPQTENIPLMMVAAHLSNTSSRINRLCQGNLQYAL